MPDIEKLINAVKTAFEVWIDDSAGLSWFNEDEVIQAEEDAIALLKDHDKEVKAAYRRGLEAGRTIKWD